MYHADGRPDQLTYTTSFGYDPNYYFFYDGQKRLQSLLISHSRTQGGDASVWHKYGYNSANQIITDTLFNLRYRVVVGHSPVYININLRRAGSRENRDFYQWSIDHLQL